MKIRLGNSDETFVFFGTVTRKHEYTKPTRNHTKPTRNHTKPTRKQHETTRNQHETTRKSGKNPRNFSVFSIQKCASMVKQYSMTRFKPLQEFTHAKTWKKRHNFDLGILELVSCFRVGRALLSCRFSKVSSPNW